MNIRKIIRITAVLAALSAILASYAINAEDKPDESDSKNNKRHFTGLLEVHDSLKITSSKTDYEGFRVGFCASNHTPRWVAWELLATETDGAESRRTKFWHDDSVEGCGFTEDYRKSGFDRGHMCPAADQKWSEKAMSDCFVMTNICPQNHSLNSGAWQTLEKRERLWARRDSALIIISGPVYEKTDTARIGKTGIRIPSAFYKIIAAPYADPPRGIAFVYPNMSSPGNMKDYAMTIREVEALTGLDFLFNLPDNIENEIETKSSFKEWNRF